jgi:hypothetical protein
MQIFDDVKRFQSNALVLHEMRILLWDVGE